MLGVSIEVNKDMKKLIAIIILGMMVSAFPLAVEADDQQIINATFNPAATVAIVCNQTTWTPSCALGGTEATDTAWGNLSNTGNVNVIVNVSATNTENWLLGSAPAHNVTAFNMTGFAAINLATSSQTWCAELEAPNNGGQAWEHFGLNVDMPTTSSTGENQHTALTFTAEVL